MAPWKAIHFPLPAQFEPPCTNMILTITGFEDRDRDYAKVRESRPEPSVFLADPDQTLYSNGGSLPPRSSVAEPKVFFPMCKFIRDSRFGLLTTVLSLKCFYLKLKDSLRVPE
jgi:hypothetical protein